MGIYRIALSIIILLFAYCPQMLAAEQELEDLKGRYHPMSDYIGQGKWVVVNVWSPSCSACVKELPNLLRLHENQNEELDIIAVTVDYPSFAYGKKTTTTEFLQQSPLPYPVFLADHESASNLIGNYLVAIPLVALFDPQGKAVARWPGPINNEEVMEFIANYDALYFADPFLEEH